MKSDSIIKNPQFNTPSRLSPRSVLEKRIKSLYLFSIKSCVFEDLKEKRLQRYWERGTVNSLEKGRNKKRLQCVDKTRLNKVFLITNKYAILGALNALSNKVLFNFFTHNPTKNTRSHRNNFCHSAGHCGGSMLTRSTTFRKVLWSSPLVRSFHHFFWPSSFPFLLVFSALDMYHGCFSLSVFGRRSEALVLSLCSSSIFGCFWSLSVFVSLVYI